MERLLWYLFAGSRGGPTRIDMMRHLLEQPTNAHQLAKDVGRDYKTVEYNLRVLHKHVVVVSDDPKAYGALYYPSKNFLAHLETFEKIASGTKASSVRPRAGRARKKDPAVGES